MASIARLLVATATLAAGCFDPTPPLGAPCVESATCPSDQVCFEGSCRAAGDVTPGDAASDAEALVDASDAPGPDMPGVDSDEDGVVDSADNCPAVKNADQHDEDEDLVGDSCDSCPHLAVVQTDSDGDSVGNLCDPDPNTPGDSIAYFDPFTTARPEWSFSAAGWTYGGDQLRASAMATPLRATLARPSGNSTIAIAGTVAWAAAIPRQVTVNFGATASYHYCELYDAGLPALEITRYDQGSFSALATTPWGAAFPDGSFAISTRASVTTPRIDCIGSIGATKRQAIAAAPAHALGSMISIDVEHAEIALDYLIVFASPN